VIGVRSLYGETYFIRGISIVTVISLALMVGGLLLIRSRQSTWARIIASVVCVLGAIREISLMEHGELSVHDGGWIGIALLGLYTVIFTIVWLSFIVERRKVTAQ
jgi:hypothetical protein